MRISDWSSDVCSSDLRSPSNSSARAVPHASSYHLPCLLVSFSNVMVAFCNSMQHSQSRRFANQGQNVMPRIIFVNLPVSDIAAAMRCYDALGFTNEPRFTDETAACMVLSDTIRVMLLTHDKWKTFTTRPIPPSDSSEVMLAISCESKEEVNRLDDTAGAKGGNADPTPDQAHRTERRTERKK